MKRFQNGSRVCFLGDSLVNENLILAWVANCYKKSFPNEDIRFFNCGTAGGTAEFALKSFEDDVLRFKPTHVVVSFGINDSSRWCLKDKKGTDRYNVLKQSFETYKKCIEKLCEKILDNNMELILCTPAPYDEYETTDQESLKGGYALMSEYANFIRYFAKEKNYTLCDYYEKMLPIMQTDKLYNPDHIHPTAHGYYRMAEIFLNEQGLKIGEEFDILERFPQWISAIRSYREIYIAECMVLKKAELSVDEKIKLAENFLDANENTADDWRSKWFVDLCRKYLKNRKDIETLSKEMEEIYLKEISSNIN